MLKDIAASVGSRVPWTHHIDVSVGIHRLASTPHRMILAASPQSSTSPATEPIRYVWASPFCRCQILFHATLAHLALVERVGGQRSFVIVPRPFTSVPTESPPLGRVAALLASHFAFLRSTCTTTTVYTHYGILSTMPTDLNILSCCSVSSCTMRALRMTFSIIGCSMSVYGICTFNGCTAP